ncbi:hypothetical protein SteCoe_18217 [Stentor coeruleus]|uniref:Uncharacterized protein n=1 Tax=Stentor coeruleus TaxID=5963 RepID=A0A1R2BX43_9CILI|nr:hypothetical protein SteCoe_18217 [Stentor coeruleus]
MNNSLKTERLDFSVKHPQLELDISNQRLGRKRYDQHKNFESTRTNYGYSNLTKNYNEGIRDSENISIDNKKNIFRPLISTPVNSNSFLTFEQQKAQEIHNRNPYENNDIEKLVERYNENKRIQRGQSTHLYSMNRQSPLDKIKDLPVSYTSFSNKYLTESEPLKNLESSKTTAKIVRKPLDEQIFQKKQQDINYDLYQDKITPKPRYSSQDPNVSKDHYNNLLLEKNYEITNNTLKSPRIYDEIDKLQAELKMKEAEIAKYQEILLKQTSYSQDINNTPNPQIPNNNANFQIPNNNNTNCQISNNYNPNPQIPNTNYSQNVLNQIAKLEYDKQKIINQRLQNLNDLESQLYEKYKEKQTIISLKEKEQQQRLEMLRIIKELDTKERIDKAIRAKEYREQLDFQSQVKKVLMNTEKIEGKADSFDKKSDVFRYKSSNLFTNTNNQGIISSPPKFTKKSPKTVCYNPITGDLKDTSEFVFGPHPFLGTNSIDRKNLQGGNGKGYKDTEDNKEIENKLEIKNEDKFLSGYGSLVIQNNKS